MNKNLQELYKAYKRYYIFEEDINSMDDTLNNNYIYAWYSKTNPKKYFYVGRGKNERYKHILWDIGALKNPRKYKGKPYKLLQDTFGIECDFIQRFNTKGSCYIRANLHRRMYKKSTTFIKSYNTLEYFR